MSLLFKLIVSSLAAISTPFAANAQADAAASAPSEQVNLPAVSVTNTRGEIQSYKEVYEAARTFDALAARDGLTLRGQLIDAKSGERVRTKLALLGDTSIDIDVDADGGWEIPRSAALAEQDALFKAPLGIGMQIYVGIVPPDGRQFRYRDIADAFDRAVKAQHKLDTGLVSLFRSSPNSMILDFGVGPPSSATILEPALLVRPPDRHGYVGIEYNAQLLASNPMIRVDRPVHRVFPAYVNARYYEKKV